MSYYGNNPAGPNAYRGGGGGGSGFGGGGGGGGGGGFRQGGIPGRGGRGFRDDFGGRNQGRGGEGQRGGGRAVVLYNEKGKPRTIDIITNYCRVKVKESITGMALFQYHIKIIPLKREFSKDEAGETLKDASGRRIFTLVPKEDCDLFKDKDGEVKSEVFSSEMTRIILSSCQNKLREEGMLIYTDGSSTIFTLDELYSKADPTVEPPVKKVKKSYYGPNEDQNDDEEDIDVPTENCFYTDVRLKGSEDEKLLQRKDYRVKFVQVAKLVFSTDVREHKLIAAATDKIRLVNFLNIGIKNVMMNTMETFGLSTDYFYPMNDQRFLTSQKIRDHVAATLWAGPITGVRQSAQLLGNDQLFLMANFCLRWATKKVPLFLVNERNKTRGAILGVSIDNVHQKLPQHCLDMIEKALKKARFHVEYEKGGNWVEAMKAQNKTDQWIRDRRKFTKRGVVSMFRSKDQTACFLPTASDHSFTNNKNITYTVAEYYDKERGVPLKYPFLPIVRISEIEWFPVEFLWQAIDSKRMENSTDTIDCALKFNDEHTGWDRVDRSTKLLYQPSKNQTPDLANSYEKQMEFFNRLNLEVEKQPFQTLATVLNSPNLIFKQPSDSFNGSWNLMDTKFESPAFVSSFAVVNCLEHGNQSHSEILERLIHVCTSHGMKLPYYASQIVREVSVFCEIPRSAADPDSARLENQISSALERAKREFLYDRGFKYSAKKIFFRTNVGLQGRVFPCFVDYRHRMSNNKLGIYVQNDAGLIDEGIRMAWQPTHFVTLGREERMARLMYGIDDATCAIDEKVIDLFDICYDGQSYSTVFDNQEYRFGSVQEVFHVYEATHEQEILNEMLASDVQDRRPVLDVDEKMIECPAILFFLINKKDTKTYNSIKNLCRVKFGVQSQVISYDNYNMQRNKDQYCSNVALKINTKLANLQNKVRAWKIVGHSWITEGPTLVMSYSMALGQGSDNTMSVAAAALLDGEGLAISEDFGFQEKNSIVEGNLLKTLTKNLILDFLEFNKSWPDRAVIYRHGGPDGQFGNFLSTELRAIKDGMKMALIEYGQGECDLSGLPLVTFVVVQSQHGVQIVPVPPVTNSPNNQRLPKNVPSGTCVDLAVQGFTGLNLSDPVSFGCDDLLPQEEQAFRQFDCTRPEDSTFDFQLISQHGLKGTSKPVYCRCIWNENYWLTKNDSETKLTKDVLKNLTFGLSFQYGTATKATRLGTVLRYADRMANASLGYFRRFQDVKEALEGQDADDEETSRLRTCKDIFVRKSPISFHIHQTA